MIYWCHLLFSQLENRLRWLVLSSLVFFSALVIVVKCESTCATYDNCYDINNDVTYVDGDVWISVKDSEQTCAECICMEAKEYTVSCVEFEVANKSQLEKVRKNNSRIDSEKKFVSQEKGPAIDNIEVELSETEAFKIGCTKGSIPLFDPRTGAIVVRHKHYYYMSRIMYCCTKPSLYKVIHPQCKVIFDELCNSHVVNKDIPTVECNKPFELVMVAD